MDNCHRDGRCVLAAVMSSVDLGYHVILLRDAVRSPSDEGQVRRDKRSPSRDGGRKWLSHDYVHVGDLPKRGIACRNPDDRLLTNACTRGRAPSSHTRGHALFSFQARPWAFASS
jgi:hypothetical protein